MISQETIVDVIPRDPTTPATALRKPVDLGNGVVAASFTGDGGWLSMGRPHPASGFVEVSGMPGFDHGQRGDPDAVRRYREDLTRDHNAFLHVELDGESTDRQEVAIGNRGPRWVRTGAGWRAHVSAFAVPERPILIQDYWITANDGGAVRAAVTINGRIDACAFAEITEIDPLERQPTLTKIGFVDDAVLLSAEELPARAVIHVGHDGELDGWAVNGDRHRMFIRGETELAIRLTVTLHTGSDGDGYTSEDRTADNRRETAAVRPTPAQTTIVEQSKSPLDHIATGALRYITDCTALAIPDRGTTILTDHRLLPLSWTRDAYYQANLLLAARQRDPRATGIVEGHLHWLFTHSRTPQHRWMRSHYPHGQVKDRSLQADQQLYPLLELADFRAATGRWPRHPGGNGQARTPAETWGERVREVWHALPRDDACGLLTGDENPADDPCALPLLLSTQILYWHTANQLDTWSNDLELKSLYLSDTAEHIRTSTRKLFDVEGPSGRQWSYESDGATHRIYHDANDLPTAMAPLWGFCDADDPMWRATMDFAFSPDNPGYAPGPFGGLGSAHTPGVWTLGDAQDIAVGLAVGDSRRVDAACDKLSRLANIDGLLPETYDQHTGRWTARHWFAWPSAIIGSLHLGNCHG